MNIFVERLSPDEFNKISEDAHLGAFGDFRPKEFNRFNYALVAHNSDKGLTAYATVLEHDAESAYMQHGASFYPDNGIVTTKSYFMIVGWLKKHYPVITTRIFNWNIPMIKLALQAGFLIHGVEYYKESENFKGGVLLCFSMENQNFNNNLEVN